MILARVVGDLYATIKNENFRSCKILIVQPLDVNQSPRGTAFLALDRVDAGPGDVVLVNKEGGGARILFKNPEIPVQAVIVAVVDGMEIQE